MPNAPTYKHGEFCWFEVNTPDAEAARKFYGGLFGWKTQQMDMGGFPYHTLHLSDKPIGGIMPMTGPEWQGVPPHWMLYVAVDDVDAAAKKVVELGGKVCVPPTTIPVGRFAVVNDPQGATFSLFQTKPA
jgi:predicted enzyme related to lactoylglutathione lyase